MVKQLLHQSVGGYSLACWRTLLLYSAGSCKVRALLLNTEIRYGMDQIKADNRGIEIKKPGQKADSHQFVQDQKDLADQANPECQLIFASQ